MWDREWLDTLVANVPGAIYRCKFSSDWEMEFMSQGIEPITGYPAAEFIGNHARTYASVIHPDDCLEVEREVEACVERREPFTLEYRVVTASGEMRWVHEQGQADGGRELIAGCLEALSEQGEGFSVEASWGAVAIPDEAPTATAALVMADQRMYDDKGVGRASAKQQTRDLILRVLAERHPELHEHVGAVAAMARAVGERMGMPDDELDSLERAAELHDIGKIAIPDAILSKPGPLDPEEWSFMHRHTLIGESMLSAAPALRSAAKLVRSSHERYDGKGYPDGLEGEAIPLASRIIFVCDAFHAMTSERPYGTPREPAAALAELTACAGTQFDPAVVKAFKAELGAGAELPQTAA